MTEVQIYGRCLGMGMTPAGAAGATANILAESAGRADNLEDTKNALFGISDAEYIRQVDAGQRSFYDSAGFGICQWTASPRKKKFLEFMKAHGWSIADEQGQYQYLAKELREDYPEVWRVLTTTSDPYEAGYIMCKKFEIPANTEITSRSRGAKAREIFVRCSGTSPVVQPATSAATAESADPDLTPPTSEYWPPRTIDRNMRGDDVAVLQAILTARKYSILVINGLFDSSTEYAVRKYQKQHGLKVDGVVGPLTWASLLSMRR